MSNAERQKRYRDNKRNAPVTRKDENVTVRPRCNALLDMSDLDLQLKLKSYPDASWVNSPEHREVVRRRAVHELVDETISTAGVCL